MQIGSLDLFGTSCSFGALYDCWMTNLVFDKYVIPIFYYSKERIEQMSRQSRSVGSTPILECECHCFKFRRGHRNVLFSLPVIIC